MDHLASSSLGVADKISSRSEAPSRKRLRSELQEGEDDVEDDPKFDATISAGNEVDDIHPKDIIFYTSIRFGKVIFHDAPHKLLKRNKWSLKEEIRKGNGYWKLCTPCIDSGQLFILSVRGKKLPKNFSFVAGYELKLAGCARPEIEEIESLALLNTGLLITLSEETDYYLGNLRFKLNKHDIQHLVFQTPNGGAPSLQDMDICVSAIQQCISEGKLAVVHCHAGEGRTGTILAAFLCKNSSRTGKSCKSNEIRYFTPQEAISALQVYRHRSLQGWTAKDDTYTNNNVQVGQLEKYFQAFVLPSIPSK